jgi:hypothetical protein
MGKKNSDGVEDMGGLGSKDRQHSRHPLFGWMKGTVTIAPGTDLTEPTCPEWADIAEESCAELAKMIEDGIRERKS